MTRVLQVARGALVMAIAWGVLWALGSAVYALVMLVVRSTTGGVPIPWRLVPITVGLYAPVGLWAGACFAVLLAIAGRRGTLASIGMSRAVLLGTIAGLSWPLAWWTIRYGASMQALRAMAATGLLCVSLGILSAAAMLSIARRGSGEGAALE